MFHCNENKSQNYHNQSIKGDFSSFYRCRTRTLSLYLSICLSLSLSTLYVAFTIVLLSLLDKGKFCKVSHKVFDTNISK